tara:strand:- start:16729 stop:16845 length:117 start_codon:yes stop_codon:yes gene_type:complete
MSSEKEHEKLQELSLDYAEIKQEIEEKEFRWLELAEKV